MEILPRYCMSCGTLYESQDAFEDHVDGCEPLQDELYRVRSEKADKALDDAWEKTNERR